jgi:hypothetical protein
MLNFNANIKYQSDKEYTREEKEYFLAMQSFNWITSDYNTNDTWVWRIIHKGIEDKGVSELTDAELEEEWLYYKKDAEEDLLYEEEENEHQ